MLATVATAITPAEHTLTVRDRTGDQQTLAYDALMVGTGAVPVRRQSKAWTGWARPTVSTYCTRWATLSTWTPA